MVDTQSPGIRLAWSRPLCVAAAAYRCRAATTTCTAVTCAPRRHLLGARGILGQIWGGPADRAWCVATEIDNVSTYVGGTPELAVELIPDTVLGAIPIMPAEPFQEGRDYLSG